MNWLQPEPGRLSHCFLEVPTDLTPRQFLGLQGEELPSVTQINIVLNWFEELKRLVPTGR